MAILEANRNDIQRARPMSTGNLPVGSNDWAGRKVARNGNCYIGLRLFSQAFAGRWRIPGRSGRIKRFSAPCLRLETTPNRGSDSWREDVFTASLSRAEFVNAWCSAGVPLRSRVSSPRSPSAWQGSEGWLCAVCLLASRQNRFSGSSYAD
jgi:hypothetical protein